MKGVYAMKRIILAVIFLCAACADTGATADKPVIRASGFIYDPNAKTVVLDNGAFVYDANAPALRASQFLVTKNP
jgi:hypothetical protein